MAKNLMNNNRMTDKELSLVSGSFDYGYGRGKDIWVDGKKYYVVYNRTLNQNEFYDYAKGDVTRQMIQWNLDCGQTQMRYYNQRVGDLTASVQDEARSRGMKKNAVATSPMTRIAGVGSAG